MIEIPLNSSFEQLFSIVISGNTYDCRVSYNHRAGIWVMSFRQGDTSIVEGIPLVGGVDLLKHHDIDISNIFAVNVENPNEDAGADNLGTSVRLFVLTDEEIGNG